MKDLKQMDFFPSTSSQEDTLANLSPLQVEKKVKKIQDTSGQSILDLSKNSDQLGLLEKMLVDTLNSVSTPYLRTWKVKVTPQGRLVFQLRASVQTTKEKESGLWRTPDNMAGGSNLPGIKKALDEGHLKRPSGQQIQVRLQDQVKEPRLWPTPRASQAMNENIETIRKRNKKRGMLEDKVAMWPTPAAHEGRLGYQRRDTGKKGTQKSLTTKVIDKEGGREKTTGQLNPTWVEWLMGYPIGWTDLNVSETALSHKSPTTSDPSSFKVWPTPRASNPGSRPNGKGGKVLSEEVMIEEGLRQRGKKLWRTPTTIDGGDNAEKYAARILLGKNKRSSKHKVQETLSMQVAMEGLKNDPKRVEEIMKDEMTTRPYLPEQQEFVNFLSSQTTARELSKASGIDYTKVEHWFRKGKYFSHPSIDDWNHIKKFLKKIKFDKEMTTTETIEWKK